MDPTEVKARSDALADEFPTISQLVTLPHRTNGYQRRAQATMAGDQTASDSTPARADQAGAIALTSRSWGHEGGNDITAEFRDPGAANAPLTVSVTGNDSVVSLGTMRRAPRTAPATRSLRRSTPTPPPCTPCSWRTRSAA